MRRGRWDNWGTIAVGLALVLSWLWHDMLGLGGGLILLFGLGVVLASVVSITKPGALTGEAAIAGLGGLPSFLRWLLVSTNAPGPLGVPGSSVLRPSHSGSSGSHKRGRIGDATPNWLGDTQAEDPGCLSEGLRPMRGRPGNLVPDD